MTKSEEIIEDWHKAMNIFYEEYPKPSIGEQSLEDIVKFLLEEIRDYKHPIC